MVVLPFKHDGILCAISIELSWKVTDQWSWAQQWFINPWIYSEIILYHESYSKNWSKYMFVWV